MASVTRKFTLKAFFSDFSFFYSFLGRRMFFSLALSFSVGLMDGLGLAMFIPLLQMVGGNEGNIQNTSDVGNLQYLLDGFSSVGIPLTITSVLLLILTFFSLKGLFRFLESYYSVVLMTTFVKKVRINSIESISQVNYKYFVKIDSGRIQNTLSGEMERVQWAYRNYSAAIQAFMTVIVYVSLAFLSNPKFAILVAIGGGITNIFYSRLYRKTKETSRKITADGHIFHGLMMQLVNNFKYLRSTGQIKPYSNKLKKTIVDLAAGNKKIGFFNSLLVATKEPLSILVVVVIIFVQVNYFDKNIGPIILSLLFFYRSLNTLIVFQNYWNTFLNVSGSLENFQNFIKEMRENKKESEKGEIVGKISQIRLSNVEFSYQDKMLLRNVNVRIDKNRTVAFVGPSGSGKTTLINMITGLLPVGNGRVEVNGKNIDSINLQEYQTRIGYITQEPVIFNDTLFNNVTSWAEKTETNLRKFEKVIQQASLSEFLNSLPEKENAQMGNAGILISGGQKQRIAIARELFKEVDLLILDEATSALDSATEREIQEYFENLQGKYTLVVIAHRLSTIKNADLIYLLKDGEIQNQGSFDTLLEESNDFRLMVELQQIE